MHFEKLIEFDKDFKRLKKKYRTLDDDLEIVKKVLNIAPNQRPPFSLRIEGLKLETCVIKVKKIACRSLKGRGANSGLRLIYAYFEKEERIVFIEIYHKNEKELENRDRILKNFY